MAATAAQAPPPDPQRMEPGPADDRGGLYLRGPDPKEQAASAKEPVAPAREAAAAEEPVVPAPAKASEPAPGVAATTSAEAGEAGDADTSPLPVIRDTDPPPPKPEPFSVWEPVLKKKSPEPDGNTGGEDRADDADRRAEAEPLSADTQQKLEKIKDLYLTAEAIGEEALTKHFDQLSKMQRSLISEFFEEAGLGANGTPTLLTGDESDGKDDGAASGEVTEAAKEGASGADRVKSGWRAAVSRRRPREPANPRPAGPPPPR